LIESNGKKAAFLHEVVRILNLNHVIVINRRAEDYSGQAQLVTMRAVEKFEKAAKLALKLVEPGGRLALMIGSAQINIAEGISRNLSWQGPTIIPGGHSRVLLVGTKTVRVE